MWKKKAGRPKKTTVEICAVEECDKPISAKKLCQRHYVQSRKGIVEPYTGKQIRPLKRVPRYTDDDECIVKGCAERPVSTWMCVRHSQQRATGMIDGSGKRLRDPLPTRKPRGPNWRGKVIGGYVVVVAPEGHPGARKDGTILEHRLVMEQLIGRVLKDHEIVHHKNGDRADNSPGNLEILDGRSTRPSGPGHPPGHDMDHFAAIQVLLQRGDIADELRLSLEGFREDLADATLRQGET